jgi:hypothetical protein
MRILGLPINVRRGIIVLAFIGVLILGGAIWSLPAFENRLTVENHSGQTVSILMIGVYGSSWAVMFEHIPDGSERSASFHIMHDGGFYVHGFLADGTNIAGGFYGYLTNGMFGERVRFVIKSRGGLDFSQGGD